MFGLSLVNSSLELFVLSTQNLYLSLDCLELDFSVFSGKHLVFEVTLGL